MPRLRTAAGFHARGAGGGVRCASPLSQRRHRIAVTGLQRRARPCSSPPSPMRSARPRKAPLASFPFFPGASMCATSSCWRSPACRFPSRNGSISCWPSRRPGLAPTTGLSGLRVRIRHGDVLSANQERLCQLLPKETSELLNRQRRCVLLPPRATLSSDEFAFTGVRSNLSAAASLRIIFAARIAQL